MTLFALWNRFFLSFCSRAVESCFHFISLTEYEFLPFALPMIPAHAILILYVPHSFRVLGEGRGNAKRDLVVSTSKLKHLPLPYFPYCNLYSINNPCVFYKKNKRTTR